MRERAEKLSAVIVSPDGAPRIARALAALRAQTAADRIEVVIVAPREAPFPAAAELRGPLADLRVVKVDSLDSVGQALAVGFRAAGGELIACCEEHSFPEPGWAAALLAAAADDDAAAFGATLENANPERAISWAHLFSDFGPAVGDGPGGEASELPGHQTAYRRRVLAELGAELGSWLEVEWVLHQRLRQRGERLRLLPDARVRHLNVSRLRSQLRSELQGGRAFGASRAALLGWPPARRLGYAAAAPLLLAVRVRRSIADVRRSGHGALLPRLLPALIVGLVANVAGQLTGYLLGAGDCRRRRRSIELERWRHLEAAESRAFAPPGQAA